MLSMYDKNSVLLRMLHDEIPKYCDNTLERFWKETESMASGHCPKPSNKSMKDSLGQVGVLDPHVSDVIV